MSLPQFSLPQFSNYADLSQLVGSSKGSTQTLDDDAILARVQKNWRARLPPSADSGMYSGSSGWEDVRSFVARDDEPEVEYSEERNLRSRYLSIRPDVFVQETQDPIQSLDSLVQGTCVDSSQTCEQLFRLRSLPMPLDQSHEPLALGPDDIPDPPSEAELPASDEEEDVEIFEAGPGPPLEGDGVFDPGFEPRIEESVFRAASQGVISGSQSNSRFEAQPIFRSSSQPAFRSSQPISRSEPQFVVRPGSQSAPRSTSQPRSQSAFQASQSVSRLDSQSVFQPPSQSLLRPASQAIVQPTSQSIFQPASQSTLIPSSQASQRNPSNFLGPAPLVPSTLLDDYVPTPSSPIATSMARTVSSPLSRRTDHSLTSIPSPSPSDYTSTWTEIVADRERRLQTKKKVESPIKTSRKLRSASFSTGDLVTPHHDSRQKTKHILKDVASILCNTDGPERRRRTRKRSTAPRMEDSRTFSLPDPVEEEDLYPEGILNFSERQETQEASEMKPAIIPGIEASERQEAEPPPPTPLPPLEPLTQPIPEKRVFPSIKRSSSGLSASQQKEFRFKSSPPFETPLLEHDYLDEADDVPSPPRSEFCSRPQDIVPAVLVENDHKHAQFLSPPRPLKPSPPFTRSHMIVAPLVRDTPSPAIRDITPSPSAPQSRPFPSSTEPPVSGFFDSPSPVRPVPRREPLQSSNDTTQSSTKFSGSTTSLIPSNPFPQTPSHTALLPWGNSTSPQVSPASPQMYQITPPHNAISPAPPTPLPITPLHFLPATQPYPCVTSSTDLISSKKGPEPILLVLDPSEDEEEAADWNMGCESQILDFPAEIIPPRIKSRTPKSKFSSVTMSSMPAPMIPRDEMSQVLDFPNVMFSSFKRKKVRGRTEDSRHARDR